ncbi:unnamed protein product [Staurois parvus]|uniref:Uncharacterized protein n=1 Tax=Staurois parvus TaxID=386267 RepID=A0ABN9BYF3_9NEOB|nr:unnamed protein product [Staurois parvus]
MGGGTGTPRSQLWAQQQRDQAVRGPMADLGPGGSYGRPVICQHPMSKIEHNSSV